MKGLDEFSEVLAEALKEKKQTGSDYTGTVTRVDGSTAYVQIDGSDIADTPASMSVSCKPGDRVRVRVVSGRSWITGNDTAPPTDDSTSNEIAGALADFFSDFHTDAFGNSVAEKKLIAAGGLFNGLVEVMNKNRVIRLCSKKGDEVYIGQIINTNGVFEIKDREDKSRALYMDMY